MFGKLLKNDLKAQWHSMSGIFLAIAFIAVAAEIVTLFTENQMISVLGGMVVFFAMGGACVIVLLAMGILFSQTMFGKAGYLTLTLPVKTGSLLLSKTLSGLIWLGSVFLLFMGSLFLWIYQVQEALGDDVMQSVESLLEIFGVPSVLTITIGVTFLCLNLAILVLVAVQALHLSITLSNISPLSKFGNLGMIVMFFVIFYAVQTVTSSLGDLLPVGFVVTADSVKFASDIVTSKAQAGTGSMAIGFAGSVFRICASILLHYPTVYLVNRKINIK